MSSGNSTYARLAYRFKRLLEGSILRQMMVLLLASMIVVWVFGLLLNLLGVQFEHGDNFWFSIITMISSDSIFELDGQSFFVKIIILVLAFIGIVVFNGILIAIIVGKLMSELETLKKGHGDVHEQGHFIFLGWNEVIPHMLDELETHCLIEHKRRLKVVIMLDTINDETEQILTSRPHVEVIRRSGSFYNFETLQRIRITQARGVVIFGAAAIDKSVAPRLSDALVTKVLVSIEALLSRRGSVAKRPALVANYFDDQQVQVIDSHLREFGAKSERVFFNPLFYTAKLISSMCANPYAYSIYNELLTAEGSELHTVPVPGIRTGTPFRHLKLAFPLGIPVGFRRANGSIHIAPDDNEIVPLRRNPAGNQPEIAEMVVLAHNSRSAAVFIPDTAGTAAQPIAWDPTPTQTQEGLLVIVGVNTKLPLILEEVCKQTKKILVIDNQTENEFRQWYADNVVAGKIPDAVEYRQCLFRAEAEFAAAIDFDDTNMIVILADGHLLEGAAPDQIDADTLAKMLTISHLINDSEHRRNHQIRLIVEILTPDSEAVVSSVRNCSHVVGPLLIGRLLTTFAIYPFLDHVYRDMIQTGKVDILCLPATGINTNLKPQNWTFTEVLNTAPAAAIPIGWVEKDGKIRLNPDKKQTVPEKADIIYMYRYST